MGDHPAHRDEKQRRRDQVDEEDGDTEALAPAQTETGQGVGGREGDEKSDGRHDQADEDGVPDECQVVGVEEEKPHVFQGRSLAEPERVVLLDVEVVGLLEHRDAGPTEGEGGKEGEEDGARVEAESTP